MAAILLLYIAMLLTGVAWPIALVLCFALTFFLIWAEAS